MDDAGSSVVSVAAISDLAGLRERVAAWRAAGLRIALVPTMGALHAGHMRLVENAKAIADRVVVTIFVNPTQFAPGEDFTAYPRDLDADRARTAAAGADLVYAPSVATMYPAGHATTITVGGPAVAGLEDRVRPTHFAGVATIVAKLLGQARPDIALFGEKDFQQLLVIERMVADLDLPVRVVAVPIVREADGLALSSRNAYLDADERHRAPILQATLAATVRRIESGTPLDTALRRARNQLADAGFAVDYVEARRAATLGALDGGEGGPGRLLAAARLGRTRLIDNLGFTLRPALREG